MFRFLKRLRHRREIQRLRDRAQRDTYPRSYVEVCRTLLGYGEAVWSMEMAREGLAKFPHSDDLRDVLRHTWRMTKSSEIDALRQRCIRSTEPGHYRDLAGVYLQCEEYDEALGVAEEMARRYPECVDSWLLQAELLFKRFNKDHVATDATRALIHLKRAIELDDTCFDGHYLLARLYHYIGSISKALFHLYRALDVQPDNEAARNLHNILVKLPLEKEEESTLLRELEENEDPARHRGQDEHGAVSGPREVRSGLTADISRLSVLNGVTRVAFVSPGLTVVASRGEIRVVQGGESEPLADLARRFRKAATVSAKRMGIGAFQSAVLNAGKHMLQFHSAGMTVVLVESDDANRTDIIKTECANFVASCLRTAGETVHA